MIEPKNRMSKARSRKRRAHWKLQTPGLSVCPRCHVFKLPHRVCLECGFYDGQDVLKLSAKKKKRA